MTPEFALALVPRLHEEIAQLRRDVGIYEEALSEVYEECDGKAVTIAGEALQVAKMLDHDDTPKPYDGDPGDETQAA